VRLIITLLLGCLLWQPALAAPVPTENQLKQELKQAESSKNAPNQAETTEALQSALNWLTERKESQTRSEQYQRVIDDFPKMTQELRRQLVLESNKILPNGDDLPAAELEQQILQTSSLLLEQARLLQQEQDRTREISDSLGQLPQQQTDARRALTEVQRRLQAQPANPTTPYAQAALALLQTEAAARKAKVDELELAQLSANNRQELARMRAEVYKKRHEKIDVQLQALRNNLNAQRQREAELALEKTEQLAEQNGDLPKSLSQQLQINRELSAALNSQAQRMDLISSQQRQAAAQTLQVRQALSTIIEQAQWLGSSSALGETLRAQVATLPEMPKPQQLDGDMAQLRVQRLQFENQLEKLSQREFKRDDGSALTNQEQRIVDAQLRTQRELLNSLLSGCDTQILELTKLKVANTQLIEALNEIRDATHRYLFWVPDVNPINFSYPLNVAHDLTRVLSLDTRNADPDLRRPAVGDFQHQFAQALSRLPRARQQPRRQGDAGRILPDGAHRILVDSGGDAAAGAVGRARLRPAERLELPGGGSDRQRGDRHAADPVDLHDLRRLRPPSGAVHRALPLAGEAGFARHALLQDVDLADRAADHGADHFR
jgi:potassium efflux system protein